MPGPVMWPGLLATMRRTSGLSALATPWTMGFGWSGSASRGIASCRSPRSGGPRTRSSLASSSSQVANRPMSWRLTMVGPIIGKSPAWCRARASGGRTHSLPMSSRVVVGVGLSLRRAGEEEAGVEALRLALGGDPVGDVAHAVERQHEVLGRQHVEQGALAGVDRAAVLVEAALGRPRGRRSARRRRRPAGRGARRPPRRPPEPPRPSRPGPRSRRRAAPRPRRR